MIREKTQFEENENRWRAVLSRDETCDGTFVYGVLSTRIFCRASCPSRKPKREGAQFFDSPEAARRAGFRACKRCLPEASASTREEKVRAMRAQIEAADGAISLRELAEKIGGSAPHLQRLFKKQMGVSPREYSRALRLARLKTKLQSGEKIMDSMLDAGYNSSRALYEDAPSQLGMTPATYGRGGSGTQIHFAVAPCSLGFLLVAKTARGLCSITLGDAPEELEAELQREFFAAHIEKDEADLREELQRVLDFLEGEKPPANFPLDVRATAFQIRVWKELQNIARGETRSYAQVANAIGQPTAARAVARACATNPVALIVPCHRVVREGGALSGYRWGIERKKKLLQREREKLDLLFK